VSNLCSTLVSHALHLCIALALGLFFFVVWEAFEKKQNVCSIFERTPLFLFVLVIPIMYHKIQKIRKIQK
jgi:hypothetical protein